MAKKFGNYLMKDTFSIYTFFLNILNDICERVYDRLENINNQDYSDNPIYLFIDLENLLYDILIAKDDTRYAWYRKLSNADRYQRDYMNLFFSI